MSPLYYLPIPHSLTKTHTHTHTYTAPHLRRSCQWGGHPHPALHDHALLPPRRPLPQSATGLCDFFPLVAQSVVLFVVDGPEGAGGDDGASDWVGLRLCVFFCFACVVCVCMYMCTGGLFLFTDHFLNTNTHTHTHTHTHTAAPPSPSTSSCSSSPSPPCP